MEAKIGMIVKSAAGRDQGLFMVITAVQGDFAYVADGKVRKLENPKKKRIKHLKLTNTVVDKNNLTNKGLRVLLKEYNNKNINIIDSIYYSNDVNDAQNS